MELDFLIPSRAGGLAGFRGRLGALCATKDLVDVVALPLVVVNRFCSVSLLFRLLVLRLFDNAAEVFLFASSVEEACLRDAVVFFLVARFVRLV